MNNMRSGNSEAGKKLSKLESRIEQLENQLQQKEKEHAKDKKALEDALALQRQKNRELDRKNSEYLKRIQELEKQNTVQSSDNGDTHRITAPSTSIFHNNESKEKELNSTPGSTQSSNKPEPIIAPGILMFNNNEFKEKELYSDPGSTQSSKPEPITASGLKAVYKMIGLLPKDDKLHFTGVKLAFENKEKAKAFKAKFHDYPDNNQTSFTLVLGGYCEFVDKMLIELDENVLALQFMNSDASFKARENPSLEGEILLEELAKYVDISSIPQELRSEYHNQPLSKRELEQFHSGRESSSIKLTTSDTPKSENDRAHRITAPGIRMFDNNGSRNKKEKELDSAPGSTQNSKPEPTTATGLKTIYKIIGSLPTDDKLHFTGVKLAFENKEKAKAFKAKFHDYADNNRTSFTLVLGGYSEFVDKMLIELDENVLALQFMNSGASFKARENPSLEGEILLEELAKYVDTSSIPQELRSEYHNQPLSKSELEQFHSGRKSSSIKLTT
jgi:hypothetical protein